MMNNLQSSAFVARTTQLLSSVARLRLLLVMLLTLTASAAWAQTWEKATSIAAGDVVLLVCESKKMELSSISTTSTKYGIGVAYTTSPAGVYELTVEAGSTSGTYSLKNGTNYLYWSSGNSLATNTTKNANTSWSITISNGNATIKNAKDNSRIIGWNASSPRFACYTSSQTAVQLYKKVSTDPCASLAAPSVTTTNITNNSFTLSWNAVVGAESYNVYNYTTDVAENITTTSYTFTGLTPNTEYEWEIEAVKSTCSKGTTGTTTTRTLATITLSEAGVETPVTGKYVGDPYTLPSTTSQSCGTKTLVGWSTVQVAGTDAKPTSNYYELGEQVTLAASQTFYAVFATKETSGSGTAGWNKVTSISDLEAGATYAISNTATGGNYLSTYAGGNNFPYSTTTICKLVLGGSSNAWTFKINDASSYNNYYLTATSSTDKNYLKAVNAVDSYCKFTISFNSGKAIITCTGKNSRNVLQYNSSNNPPIFACYASGTQSAVYLQKYSTGTTITYSDYTTQCTTETVVTLHPNGGAISEDGWKTTDGGNKYTQTVETTNDNVALPTPVKEGYTFGGWYESSTFSGSAVTEIEAGTTGTKEFYAKWTINRYTLTWNLNGGKVIVAGTHASVDATGSPSGYVNYNVSVNVPEVAKEGHYFTGWTEDGTNVVTPLTKMPARDVTYIALWEEAGCPEYSFHTGGDNVKEINTQICFEPVGSNNEWQIVNYVIPADTKYFVGHHGYWYENNLGSNNSRSVVKTWSEAMYLAPAMDPSNPNGTPKIGQATGAVGTIRIFDNSNWDNLYVGFIPNGYKLKFSANEYDFVQHENTDYRSEIVEYNGSPTANYSVTVGITDADGNYVKTDHSQEDWRHIFVKDNVGWRNDGAKIGLYYWNNSTSGWCSEFLKSVPGETNLFEGWIPVAATKIKLVRYNSSKGNPGDWNDIWNQTGDISLVTTSNLFTISSWDDQTSGWSTYSSKGRFRMYNDSKSKNWYVHFYPHFVLKYDANGGEGTMEMQAVPKDALDKKVTIADCGFTRTGYNFVKWNKNASGTSTSYNPGVTYTLSADVILYAQWEAQTYNITYKDQGNVAYSGSNAASLPNTHTYATATTLVDGVKIGYTFGGWYDNPECTGTAITQLGATDYTADITLYAKWTINTHTVIWKPAGGNWSGDASDIVQTYEYGELIKAPEKPMRIGYEFVEWTPAYASDMTMPDEDLEFTAQWQINQYTVTLNPNYPDGKTGTFKDKDGNTVSQVQLTYDYNTLSMPLTDLYQSIKLDGYRFDGWYSAKGASDGTVSGSKWSETGNITRDLNFYAKWTEVDCRWIETDIANILPEDEVLVTMKIINSNGEIAYQALGTETITNSPKSQGVKVTSGVINPADNSDFEFSKYSWSISTVTGGYTLQPYGMSGTYLYGMPSYISIGNKTENNVFLIYASPENDNKCFAYVRDNAYYVGYGTEDGQGAWKRFTSYQSVLNNQTLKFYKRVCVDESNPWYTVTFNAGSGSCNTESLTGTKNEGITLPTATPSDACATDGWTFAGWWTESVAVTTTSPGELLTAGSNYKPDEEGKILYAVYSKEETSEGGDPTPIEATLSFASTAQRTSFSTTQQIWEQNGITLTNNKAASTSPVADYANPARFYAGSEIIIEAPGNITKIVATCAETKHTTALVNSVETGASSSNNVVTIIPVAASTTYTIDKLTAQVQMSSLTVTYLGTGGGPTTTYNSNPDCATYTLTFNDRGVETSDEYSAGYQVPQPADPTDVCTEPIEYVFDGWATAEITAENVTSYEKVTFPFTMPAEPTTLYAVYRYVEEGSGDSGDYVKVTEDLDDYSGDYLIVYEEGGLALNGALEGDNLDASGNSISVTITNNTIVATDEVNASNFTIAKENDDEYSIRSASGYYIGQSTNANDLKTNSTEYYANTITLGDDDKVDIVSSGAYLRYNANSGSTNLRFRYYKSDSYTSQKAIALYRKAASYLYTTSPVCGPHLVITEGKEIYVTGGNAGGTRDLVIAQQKVSYKATRLNVGPTSQVPDVKVATNGITVGGVVTSDVKVTIDQTKELQSDDTYTITGTLTVQYQPSANNKQEDIQVQLAVDYNTDAKDNFTVHARSLPAEFVIVAKSGDKWYALNGDMNNGSSANPANGQVTLDDDANPTKATYAPCNTIYTFDGLPNTGDRTRVRFQGTDGAWLWAASGTNVGIQNKSLKDTPEGDNKAYNWKLYTEDNITYRFGNANNSRQLTLSGEKFGMYASGVQDIRILPYVEKCLYSYAPTNLKVSVLKGTYVTLTWDAVAGATKYQYRTNGTTWTDAGTEPTVTINDLDGATEYTYYIRAYHEDAGVSQECVDYAEITFTTADCDDVPTNITYTADLNSITVSWTAAAPTATIKLFMNEDGTGGGGTYPGATSPYTISGGLNKNTTYYIQILSDGTCASPIIPVKTEDVELDIVEWKTDGIVVDINTNETVGVTLENEVSYGTGLGSLAEDLFFSKYFEGSGSLKMIAIYNGTGKDVDLTDYFIYKGHNGSANFDEDDQDKISYPLSELGVIKQGQEIVLYSWPLNTDAEASVYSCSQTFLHSIANESGQDANPRWILCGKDPTNSITPIYSDAMNFNGDDPLLLYKDGEIIDVFGATDGESPENNVICDGYNENGNYKTRSDESWVANDVSNMDYGKTAEDFPNGEIPDDVNVDDPTITAYTARVIMFRKNSVTSGANAVTKNTNDFHTFAEEWEVRQVCRISGDGDLTCAAYQELGTFDYSDYYTKYVPMDGGTSTFDENDRNPDGTVSIYIPELYKRACSNIRVKLTNSDGEVLTDREYKVPIMITTDQATAYTEANKDDNAFYALQENLATVEVDGDGNIIATYPLSLDEVREICKTCDVVIRDNATLTKALDDDTNDHPQVNNVMIYEGASLEIPSGADYNYTINSLSLRRKGDIVASAKVEEGGKLHLPASATAPIYLDMRIDANNWHWFTLPYDCNIADVTWVDGTPAQYNKDWFIMYYDGNSRANEQSHYENHWKVYNGTTIEAGKGYIVGIQGDITHPNYTFELRFPMATEVLTNEHVDKTVAVNAWGVNMDITPNKKGWNLVGNPYLDYYKTSENISFKGLSLIKYGGIDSVTGDRLYDDNGNIPFLVSPVDGGWYEYKQELASEVEMNPFTAYFVQVGDPANENHTDGMELHAKFVSDHRGRMSLIRRAPQEVDGEQEPVIVRVEVANAKGESDKTTLIIDDRFTNEYEMNGDFFKWFGDYYRRYTKPVLYSMGADQGKRAFNALSEQLASQPVALGMFAAQAGEYTFSLTRKRCDLSRVEEVWLYDATTATYTNLMQQDYTFTTAKTEGEGRFYLSVKMKQKTPTAVENVNGNLSLVAHQQTLVLSGLPADAQVWVYDATGKLLHSEHTTAYQRIYPVQQAGVYFVSVKGQGDAQTLSTIVK